MKFYLHCEDPELTMVIVWDRNGTIQDVINIFKESFIKKFPDFCKSGSELVCQIANSKGKDYDHSAVVSKVVKHMDDLYVKVNVQEKTLADDLKQLKVEETEKLKNNFKAERNAAILHVGNGRIRKAIQIYKDMLKKEPNNKSALIGLSTCYRKAERSKEFLQWSKKGFTLYKDDVEFHVLTGEALIECNDGAAAIEVLMKGSKLARMSGGVSADRRQEIQVLLARAYLLNDEKDMAITLLQGVIRDNVNNENALVLYADLLFSVGPEHKSEAVSVLVSVLAKNKNNNHAKAKLAGMCKHKAGMDILLDILSSASSDSSAYEFLANCLRDFGAIEECLLLLKKALELSPKDPALVLLYIHTLEHTCNYGDILLAYKQFFQQYGDVNIGTFKCSVLEAVIRCISADMSCLNPEHQLFDTDSHTLVQPPDYSDREYTEDERYLMAILFTLVKVLYIRGLLVCILPMIALLQPLYQGRQLHLSNIRNEAAYFNCIAELFKTFDDVPSTQISSSEKYIYLIGDSHCIPPAWQKINVSGSQYIIHPILITGLKIWHLRKDGCFYPKINFHNAVRAIPDNATVVVCLGEIDCREALLRCWEKARYDTIEDGMEALVKIYLQVLKNLQKTHQWKVFLHPVLPVLDVTRPIMLQFNRILATRLLTEPSFHWLNFVNDLLTEGGESLREEFVLDGTHVHHKYLSLLENTLAEFF